MLTNGGIGGVTVRFDESDIDFLKLSGYQFEELCYDLLESTGFTGVVWRPGGGDCGRDLEATLAYTQPLVGEVRERWFFECKNHRRGVDVKHIEDKLSWSEVESAHKLVFLIGSHLTNQCRQFLKQRQAQKSTMIIVVEGKRLKQMVLQFPLLVEKYFLSGPQKALRNAMVDYTLQGWYLSPERLAYLSQTTERVEYNLTELAFMIVSYVGGDELVTTYYDNDSQPPLDLAAVVKSVVSTTKPTTTLVESDLAFARLSKVSLSGSADGEFETLHVCGDFRFAGISLTGDYVIIEQSDGPHSVEALLGRTGNPATLFCQAVVHTDGAPLAKQVGLRAARSFQGAAH